MSEQALKAASSGTDLTVAGTATGSFAVVPGGNSKPAAGNDLPVKGPSLADVQRSAKELNNVSRTIGRDLHFEVNLEGGHAVIQVLDRETGEVIRQIPPERATLVLQINGELQIRLIDELV